MMAHTQSDNSRTITRNSFWYVLDASVASMVMFLASVPVARIMGPEIVGHFIYLLFITGVAQRLANVGIPATACKYMAESLGRGEPAIAHQVFRVCLKHQAVIAGGVTAAACVLVHFLAEPRFQLMSYLIVLSMWPGMVNNIPAQANVGAEDLRANIPASVVYFVSYSAMVISTLVFHWGINGLAAAVLVSRTLELVVRYWGVQRRLSRVPRTPIPPELQRRMFRFSRQNLVLLALGLVIWDRSEILFLKHFCDIRQVAFYSLAFSIVNQLLMLPRAFSSSIGITILAQYGRDRNGLQSLMQNATRYLSLLSVPVFLGLAAIADPLIRIVYGSTYAAVIPVLWIMSIASIPRAFQTHSENLLQATENQGFMLKWLTFCAAGNLIADWLLIPGYGALGAAVANGVAQAFAVGGLWVKAGSVVTIRPPMRFLWKLTVSAAVMVAVVLPIDRVRPLPAALAAGIVAGVVTLVSCMRLTNCLEGEDQVRLEPLASRGPGLFRHIFERVLEFLIPAAQQPRAATAAVRASETE
jgi:O-antigen/teichoic acid export membrane protein